MTPSETEINPLKHLYTLFYRSPNTYGNHNVSKNFVFKGNLRQAIERARAHCDFMGIKFLFVEPFICDLRATEIAYTQAIGPSQVTAPLNISE